MYFCDYYSKFLLCFFGVVGATGQECNKTQTDDHLSGWTEVKWLLQVSHKTFFYIIFHWIWNKTIGLKCWTTAKTTKHLFSEYFDYLCYCCSCTSLPQYIYPYLCTYHHRQQFLGSWGSRETTRERQVLSQYYQHLVLYQKNVTLWEDSQNLLLKLWCLNYAYYFWAVLYSLLIIKGP